ncbi:hypothetical protein OG474_44945 [Kribbella sp. NBC_01505]|uniref:hypothetical protein n=1 Tax=Kribbella sp. NBC_01505 TaxID=2903580 RepID=UPI0038682FFB
MNEKVALEFYDVVRIGRSAATVGAGIAGRTGVVRGVSTPELFAVLVGEEVYMVDLADLTRTGERARPEEHTESINVRPQRYGEPG